MSNFRTALEDYFSNRANPKMDLNPDGLYTPPKDNVCPLCEDARWSCSSGAHLKQPEHYALKHGIPPKKFILATSPQAFGASNIGWKRLDYIEDSYLTSYGGFKWIPQEVTVAQCPECEEELPGLECTCGLYFFWSPFDALEYWGGGVIVKCELGGKIIEATKGCRAQAAVIRGVYHENNSERASKAAAMYDVPLVDFLEDYDVVDEL